MIVTMRHQRKISADYLHSGFFGIEDSLVSTTGALAGIAISSTSKAAIISAALVIIAVESTSMAASEFVSEQTEEDVENAKNPASPLVSGLIIFFGYIVNLFMIKKKDFKKHLKLFIHISRNNS